MITLSATYPESLAQHITSYMRSPVFVRLNAKDPSLLGRYFTLHVICVCDEILVSEYIPIFFRCDFGAVLSVFTPFVWC